MTAPREFAVLDWTTLESSPKFRSISWQARHVFIYLWCYCAKERTERTFWSSREHLVAQIRLWTDCPTRVVRSALDEIFAASLAVMHGNYLYIRGVRAKHSALRSWGHELSETELKLFSRTEATARPKRGQAAIPLESPFQPDCPEDESPLNGSSPADEESQAGPSAVPRRPEEGDTPAHEQSDSGPSVGVPRKPTCPELEEIKKREETKPIRTGTGEDVETTGETKGKGEARGALASEGELSPADRDPLYEVPRRTHERRDGAVSDLSFGEEGEAGLKTPRQSPKTVAVREETAAFLLRLEGTYSATDPRKGEAMRAGVISRMFKFNNVKALAAVCRAGRERVLPAAYFALSHASEDPAAALYTYSVEHPLPAAREEECHAAVRAVLDPSRSLAGVLQRAGA